MDAVATGQQAREPLTQRKDSLNYNKNQNINRNNNITQAVSLSRTELYNVDQIMDGFATVGFVLACYCECSIAW